MFIWMSRLPSVQSNPYLHFLFSPKYLSRSSSSKKKSQGIFEGKLFTSNAVGDASAPILGNRFSFTIYDFPSITPVVES